MVDDRSHVHGFDSRFLGEMGAPAAREEKYMGRRREAQEQSQVVVGDAERTGFERGERVDVGPGKAFAGATDLDLE
jgi:hypothetical protein